MKYYYLLIASFFLCSKIFASGLNVYGVGIYDIKFDGSENDQTLWTGLTRWRQNSKFEPSNDISAQNLVDLILDSI